MNIKVAAERLGMNELTIRSLMKQGDLNIGFVKRNRERDSYIIIPEMLEKEIKRIRG